MAVAADAPLRETGTLLGEVSDIRHERVHAKLEISGFDWFAIASSSVRIHLLERRLIGVAITTCAWSCGLAVSLTAAASAASLSFSSSMTK